MSGPRGVLICDFPRQVLLQPTQHLTCPKSPSFSIEEYFRFLVDFHFVFQQGMSQRHHLVSWKSVPARLGGADMALNVTACILKSWLLPALRCLWDLLPEPFTEENRHRK